MADTVPVIDDTSSSGALSVLKDMGTRYSALKYNVFEYRLRNIVLISISQKDEYGFSSE